MNKSISVDNGFTIIELMVILAIVAILSVISMPNLTTFLHKAELKSYSSKIFIAINAARGEAMKRGLNAMVAPTDEVYWSNGCRVFVDTNRNQAYDTNELIFEIEKPPSYLTITGTNVASGNTPYIMLDASGFSKKKDSSFSDLTLSVVMNDITTSTSEALAEQTRILIVSVTGRVRICKPSNDPSCVNTASQ